MPSTLTPPNRSAPSAAAAAARARGLRRVTGGSCTPLTRTPVPDAPAAAVHLALLTGHRSDLVLAGTLGRRRLYDLRTFKSTIALYAQLQRLAHAEKSGTFATSMPQLVVGAARSRPGWTMARDAFADRDRHHSRMRAWLDTLEAMGLLTWQAGQNLEGEDARTEIILLPVPPVGPEALLAARKRLSLWRERYGRSLNTGSTTGVRSVAQKAAPLSTDQQAARAVARAKARGAARSVANPAPPFGTPRTSGNNNASCHMNVERDTSACRTTTGAHARSRVGQGSPTNQTRTRRPDNTNHASALKSSENSRKEEGGVEPGLQTPRAVENLTFEQKIAQAVARAKAKEAMQEPMWHLVAGQIERRTHLQASWPEDRPVAIAGLREAWRARVSSPYAIARAGGSFTPAGVTTTPDLERLNRARARYARFVDHRPEWLPAASLGALLDLAGAAVDRDGAAARTLKGAIYALDRLSRQMRACAAIQDPERERRRRRRAEARRTPETGPFAFRATDADGRRAWPGWLALDADGQPRFNEEHRIVLGDWPAPPVHSQAFRQVVRDAYLLAGRRVPADLDGPRTRVMRAEGWEPASGWEQARRHGGTGETGPGARDGYLAARTGLSIGAVQRMRPELRAEILQQLDREGRERLATEREAFHERLADHHPRPGDHAR